jgi:hypothetical protein
MTMRGAELGLSSALTGCIELKIYSGQSLIYRLFRAVYWLIKYEHCTIHRSVWSN